MTGFGSAENRMCRVEVRSINHRFLDIYVKAPSFLNPHEITFRNMAKKLFSRGKIDIFIAMSGEGDYETNVNTALVQEVYRAFSRLKEELSIRGEIDINSMLALHEMFLEASPKYDIELISGTVQQALEDLSGMRRNEGESLAAELLSMARAMAAMNEKIRASDAGSVMAVREKFRERIASLFEEGETDDSRILQEAAIVAAKLDISEEITRIESHVRQFMETLSEGEVVGRKLDFILQELNREVNTIASKSSEYAISELAIAMKTEIEKIREQVQNIQ